MKKLLITSLLAFTMGIIPVNAATGKIDRIVKYARSCYSTANKKIKKKQDAVGSDRHSSKYGGYTQYNNNFTLYKLVLNGNNSIYKGHTVEYYCDDYSNLVFMFVYKGRQEQRLYFDHTNYVFLKKVSKAKVYRYIDTKGKIHDYQKSKKSVNARLTRLTTFGLKQRNLIVDRLCHN